jgi:hypothetical protein
LTIRDRLFRSAVVALFGAGAGFVLMLQCDVWKRAFAERSYLLEATLLGATIGAVLGFVVTDSQWIDWLRRR